MRLIYNFIYELTAFIDFFWAWVDKILLLRKIFNSTFMKSFKLFFLTVLTLMILNGCLVVSLHPLWTKESRDFHTGLIGDWLPKGDSDSTDNAFINVEGDYQLCFENLGDSTYLMHTYYDASGTIMDMGIFQTPNEEENIHVNTISRIATLVNLNGTYFLDLEPPSKNQFSEFDSFVREMNYLPVHTILKLEIKEKSIVLWELNDDRLEDLFDQKRVRLDHEEIDDVTVITASTEELQRFLVKYADDEKAFEDPMEFIKKK